MKDLPNVADPALVVGYDTADDACVYRINDSTAIIQTVDFFTPIADDPYTFGQIAAANALSDVYAMGGTPALAMNLLCVPGCLSNEVTRQILLGGHSKAVEAGCVIAGGHTIQDDEPKYGLCVMGIVSPDRILRNAGAQPGDVLILTKPVGSGIITTAQKAELVSDSDYAQCIEHMSRLNKDAALALNAFDSIHACTDITGFGLMGHTLEMAEGSGVSIELFSGSLPIMSGARELAEMGIIPGGAYRNREHAEKSCFISPGVEEVFIDLMCDPQTSGGLLVSLPQDDADRLLEQLREKAPWCEIVGRVTEKQEKTLIIR